MSYETQWVHQKAESHCHINEFFCSFLHIPEFRLPESQRKDFNALASVKWTTWIAFTYPATLNIISSPIYEASIHMWWRNQFHLFERIYINHFTHDEVKMKKKSTKFQRNEMEKSEKKEISKWNDIVKYRIHQIRVLYRTLHKTNPFSFPFMNPNPNLMLNLYRVHRKGLLYGLLHNTD